MKCRITPNLFALEIAVKYFDSGALVRTIESTIPPLKTAKASPTNIGGGSHFSNSPANQLLSVGLRILESGFSGSVSPSEFLIV